MCTESNSNCKRENQFEMALTFAFVQQIQQSHTVNEAFVPKTQRPNNTKYIKY